MIFKLHRGVNYTDFKKAATPTFFNAVRQPFLCYDFRDTLNDEDSILNVSEKLPLLSEFESHV